jgi:CRP/FNR family transcriptional regulator, cyclic AMP receptor protein
MPLEAAGRRTVALLEADPDLGEGLDPVEFERARHALRAPVEAVSRGRWSPSPHRRALGLLVVSGLVIRELRLGCSTRFAELLGPGDVLRPWQEESGGGLVPWQGSWRVLEQAEIATLGRGIARLTAHWPEVAENLTARALDRARRQSITASIPNLVRIQDRLVILFLQLAERWGQVTPDGIVVRLPLTHKMIAALAGARRPTVTTSLTALAARGLLTRREGDEWVLGPGIHAELETISTGKIVQLDQRAHSLARSW